MLLETICFEKGQYPLLRWHQQRVSKVFSTLFPNTSPVHDLGILLPKLEGDAKRKVRFLYDEKDWSVEVHDHVLREIISVQCVFDDSISYSHKYQNRHDLEQLYALRQSADEILIIKKGFVTDAFYYNVVFWDGDEWLTPKSYVLSGTRRQYLLDLGRIQEVSITVNDIKNFEKVSLINALVDLGVSEVLTENIRLK